jgi:hypothetical protein
MLRSNMRVVPAPLHDGCGRNDPSEHFWRKREHHMARKAKKVAAALIDLYSSRQQPFILTPEAFRTLMAQGKMKTRFLHDVDVVLRKRGYVLLDLHKELQLIGVEQVDRVAAWGLPPLGQRTDTPPAAQVQAPALEPHHDEPVSSSTPQPSDAEFDV